MIAYGVPSPEQMAAMWRLQSLWRLQMVGFERAAPFASWLPVEAGCPDRLTFLAWRSDLRRVAQAWNLSTPAEERRRVIVDALGLYDEEQER